MPQNQSGRLRPDTEVVGQHFRVKLGCCLLDPNWSSRRLAHPPASPCLTERADMAPPMQQEPQLVCSPGLLPPPCAPALFPISARI